MFAQTQLQIWQVLGGFVYLYGCALSCLWEMPLSTVTREILTKVSIHAFSTISVYVMVVVVGKAVVVDVDWQYYSIVPL